MSCKSLLARWLYPVSSIRTVYRGPIKGMRFMVVPGMGLTYAMGQDHWNFRFFKSRLLHEMTVYDIGANNGQMALFFSRAVGAKGQVLSFEPVPGNVVTLERNLALNDCKNVKVFAAAVSADEVPKKFCFDMEHHTMGTLEDSMIKPGTWEQTIEVPSVSLDALLARGEKPPQVMKIDVEGAGYEVIKGALNLIKLHRPAIYFELHAAHDSAPELEAVRLLQKDFGYTVTNLDGTPQIDLRAMWGGAVWCEAAI
jgi:FkbM family methyltransferase